MGKREKSTLIVSIVLWCILLSSVLFIENAVLRFLSIFIGIILVISFIELFRKIINYEGPYLKGIHNLKIIKDNKEKALACLELLFVPLAGTIMICLLLNITKMFFVLIGLY